MFTGRLFGKMTLAQVKRAGEAMAKFRDDVAKEVADRVAARKEPILSPKLDDYLIQFDTRYGLDDLARRAAQDAEMRRLINGVHKPLNLKPLYPEPTAKDPYLDIYIAPEDETLIQRMMLEADKLSRPQLKNK